MKPCIRCHLVALKESHEGSGGGFSIVRFIHLVAENRTPDIIRHVTLPYRLMKGQDCFQQGVLEVGPINPGQTVRSKGFIRESDIFDRIEWVGEPAVEADREFPQDVVRFDRRIPRSSPIGCTVIALLLGLALAGVLFKLVF